MKGSKQILKNDYIQSSLIVLSLIVLVIVIVLGYFIKEPKYSIVKDLIVIFITFYVAYVTTKHFAQKLAQDDLLDIGESAGRRIFMLSAHLRTLADEISTYSPDGDKSEIYYGNIISQLHRLAIDTELSFKDMQQIAKLDISIPNLVEETQTSVINTIKTEKITCPYCNNETKVLFDTARNASKRIDCGNCHKPFMLHRLDDGNIKIGIEDVFVIECPNPECGNMIRIKKNPKDFGTTVRNCFDCFARIRFDFDSGTVEEWDKEEPQKVFSNAIKEGRIKCPYCSWSNIVRDTHNASGQWVQYCPNCTRLMEIVEEESAEHRFSATS